MPLSVFWPLGPPASPDVLALYVTPGLYLTDLAAIGLIAIGVSGWVAGKARPLRQPRQASTAPIRLTPWISALLTALAVIALVTVPFALSEPLAFYTAVRWTAGILVFLAVTRLDGAVETVVKAFLLGLGIQVLVGVGQVAFQRPLGVPAELALEPATRGAAVIAAGGTRWLRAYGLTFHPNVLGGFLATGLLAGLPLLERPLLRPLWWLLWTGLLITFSRSAWLATAVSLPLLAGWLFLRRPDLRRPLWLTLGGAAVIAVALALTFNTQLRSRVNPVLDGSPDSSLNERGELIRIALEVIRERPITGIGAGNFPLTVVSAGSSVTAHAVHNVPLLLAAELGLIGGVLWYLLWLTPLVTVGRVLDGFDPWPISLGSAWMALGVISLWDSYPWTLNSGFLLTMTLLGLTASALRRPAESDLPAPDLESDTHPADHP